MGVLTDWQIEDLAVNHGMIDPYSPAQKRPGVISFGGTSYGYDVRVGYKFQVFDVIAGGEIDPKNFDPKLLREVDLSPRHNWSMVADNDCTYWCRLCGKTRPLTKQDSTCPGAHATKSHILIPPHSFVLAESLERFNIPRDLLCLVLGKSTYARCGLIVNVTPGEPEWEGHWTIEISNTTPLPARVYCGEGIMQVVFLRSDGNRAALEEAMRWAATVIHGIAPTDKARQIMDKEFSGNPVSCRQSYKDKKGKYDRQTGLTLPKVDGQEGK